ncbi:MAG: penicillin acylase family protein [Candidatus Aminicenantaceae bacterium]
MKKIFGFTLLSIFVFVAGLVFFLFLHFHISKPKIEGEASMQGLHEQVRIVTDEWGVPHIFAANEEDLFFATGFIHAKERMWQMDLTRRAGFGRLSEILGKAALNQDKILRNYGMKEAILKDFSLLSSKVKNFLLAYSRGVNAWMKTRKFRWPPEYVLLRCRPEPWTPLDSLAVKQVMAFLLCVDLESEAVRGNLVRRVGVEKALEILEEDITSLPPELKDLSPIEMKLTSEFQGSNNWVISGERTNSGKPLLANDPHLEISIPPIWFEIHLKSPTINVIGVSLPGVPFVLIGHNDFIAWGITNSAADVQDLFIEKLNDSKDKYLDENGWKPLLKKEEQIWIKGKKDPIKFDVFWTSRGPILSPLILNSDVPLSLQWVTHEGGQVADAFYLMNKAKSWEDFSEALKMMDAPSQNFVYADKEGNIGYYLSGKIPVRLKESALFPYPAWKEEGQWHGFLAEEDKPNVYNPQEQAIVTANQKIVPQDYPFYISVDWDAPFRANRINELLEQRESHSVESFMKIQNDIYNKKAELFLPFLRDVESTEESSQRGLSLLKNWDLQMGGGAAPALFSVFLEILSKEVFSDELGEDYESFNLRNRRKRAGLLRLMSSPEASWWDDRNTKKIETWEDIINRSMKIAYDSMTEEQGSQENWDWKHLHSLQYKHVLGQVPLFKFFNSGTFPITGDRFTVKASFSKNYKTTHGASYRLIVDLSDWANSVCVLTSGQSGHFLSRNYDDQISLWLEGLYHPMLFTLQDIESNSQGIWILKPVVIKDIN